MRQAVPTIAPDLAVEVLSESNTEREIALEIDRILSVRDGLAWVIDPNPRTVAVYHKPGEPTSVLDERGELQGDQVLPGLRILIADLFRGVPR